MLNPNQTQQVFTDQHKQRTDSKGLLYTVPHGVHTEILSSLDPCRTAHWRFDHNSGKHIVSVSPRLDENADRTIASKGLASWQISRNGIPYGGNLAVSTARHENCHVKFTEPDFIKVRKGMDVASLAEGLPSTFGWSRLNLFEDARIEDLGRRETGSKFNWLKYEYSLVERYAKGLQSGDVSPDSIFLALIQAEKVGKKIKEIRTFCAGRAEKACRKFEVILKFYRTACRTETTMDLLPLIAKFTKIFPEAEGTETCDNHGEGDIHGGDWIATIEAAEAAGAKGLSEESHVANGGAGAGADDGDDDVPDVEVPTDDGKAPEELLVPDAKAIDLRAQFPAAALAQKALDCAAGSELPPYAQVRNYRASTTFVDRGRSLAQRLGAALRGGLAPRVATASPKKRVRTRGIANGSTRIFSGRGQDRFGKPHVVVVYDASGSMDWDTENHGRAFLYAMGLIEKAGLIDLDVIVTWGKTLRIQNSGAASMKLDTAKHLTIDWLSRFGAHGEWEGFAAALKVHDAVVRKADVLLAYTDGNINDTPIDRGYWQARNIYAVGMCCKATGWKTKDAIESLGQYFDKCLVRETLEDLIKGLVPYLRKS